MVWEYIGLILYVLVMFFCWGLTCLNLPGNWGMLVVGTLYAFFTQGKSDFSLAYTPIFWALGIAIIAEVLETLGSSLGLAKGGSRKGAVLSFVGSILGGIVGGFVGIPIPILGSVVGIILFSGVGAFAGAWIGETMAETDPKKIFEVARASMVGRLLGSLAKIILGGLIFAILVLSTF